MAYDTDRNSSIVYHDLTGSFTFISFNGNVCFFVLYCYESNAIFAKPITGLDNMSIFTAYKMYFEEPTAKWFQPQLNIMDNQATKHIKKILTKNKCKLQVLEPHNHCINAAKHAIQMFKAAFIATVISHLNCGIDLPHMSRTPSTCYASQELIPPNKHTKFKTDLMTGTGTRWPT
jgi:hypothetical protein